MTVLSSVSLCRFVLGRGILGARVSLGGHYLLCVGFLVFLGYMMVFCFLVVCVLFGVLLVWLWCFLAFLPASVL